MATIWKPVTYDETNGEVRTVPSAFAARGLDVLSIVWESGIREGERVEVGANLAVIQWEDNSRESVVAPDNCSGRIVSVNRDITFENLPYEPSQWLLMLDSE